jgi:hypothetical protein
LGKACFLEEQSLKKEAYLSPFFSDTVICFVEQVAPQVSKATIAAPNMELVLPAYSIVALELGLAPALSGRLESITKFVV